MCTGLEPLLTGLGASAGVASAGATAIGALGASTLAKSVLGKQGGSDPAAERARAENEAQANANAQIAQRKRAQRASSLLATGAGGVTKSAPLASVLAMGKPVTGG